MPKIFDGEGYLSFSEPSTFDAETIEQIRQIEQPTHRAYAIYGVPDGSTDFGLFKFDAASVAADNGTTVLKPNNPFFDTAGRWILIPTGGGSGGGGALIGSGSPEGVVTANPGQYYWDDDPAPGGQSQYLKTSGAGNTGWTLQFSL